MTQTGIHFTLGERYTSYYPEIRYGLGALTEVGVKFGATSARFDSSDKLGPDDPFGTTDRVGAMLGIDLKYQLIKETEGIPLDMAIDLGWITRSQQEERQRGHLFDHLQQKPSAYRTGYKFMPYGGLEMSALYGSAVARQDDLILRLCRAGVEAEPEIHVPARIQGRRSNLGGLGIRFEY